MVTNVCVKFTYDRLRIDKALGNFRKSDNNKNKNNFRSSLVPFAGPTLCNWLLLLWSFFIRV